MKQKLYYFGYVIGAQCLCAMPVYWLTNPGTMVGFSIVMAYIAACLLGDMYVLEGFMRNKLLRTLLLVAAVIVFLPGCILMLLGTFIVAVSEGLYFALLVLLCSVFYFVWAAIMLPKKIGNTMEQSGVFA